MTRSNSNEWRITSLMLVSALAGPAARADMPPAGTEIENTGKVTYLNTRLGQVETLSTNTVSTLVSERPRFDIEIDQSYVRAPGETALFAFRITNTGNTRADIDAGFGNVTGDFSFSYATAWIDSDGNGQVDRGDTQLDASQVLSLAYGESVDVLVDVGVPETARIGQSATGTLSGVLLNGEPERSALRRSAHAAGPGQSPRRQAFGEVRVDQRGLSLQKSASAGEASSGEEIVYTLRLRNNANAPFDPDQQFDGVPLSIDGVAEEVLIVRDEIPLHTSFSRVLETTDFTAVYQTGRDAPDEWSRTPPAELADVTALGFVLADPFPTGQSRDLRFAVEVNPGTDGLVVENIGEVLLPGGPQGFDPSVSNRVVTSLSGETGHIDFHTSAGFDAPAEEAGFGDELFIEAVSGRCNVSSGIDTAAVTVSTDPEGDRELVMALETAPNSGIFRTQALPLARAGTVLAGDGVLQGAERSAVSAGLDCDPQLTGSLTLAPAGIVFDSATNEPVPGARVELVGPDGRVRQSDVTDARGLFRMADGAPGEARLRVTPPAELTAPSKRSGFAGYGRQVRREASFGRPFEITRPGRTLTVDIPVDPDLTGALAAAKTSRTVEARTGDIVTFEVELRNNAPVAVQMSEVEDRLPPGFAYLDGSALLDGVTLADPQRAPAGELVFDTGLIEPFSQKELVYSVRVTPNAGQGERTNQALVRGIPAGFTETVVSNLAAHTVRIDDSAGVFSRDGVILGKVFLDCDADGVQSNHGGAEPGLPGVQLHTSDGLTVATDARGRFSLPGLSPRTHVIDVHEPTLPAGTEVAVTRTLDAGSPGSRLVPLKAGEIRSESFAVRPEHDAQCGPDLDSRIRARIDGFDQAALGLPRSAAGLQFDRVGHRGEGRVEASRAVESAAFERSGARERPASSAKQVAATEDLRPRLADLAGVPAFLDLSDGDAVLGRKISVRVAAPDGAQVELSRNGSPVDAARIGQKVADGTHQILEYVSVPMKPGANTLTMTLRDPFGNVRAEEAITIEAPGKPAGIRLVAPREAVADPSRPVGVGVEVVDADGRIAAAPLEVTLVARTDRFDARDARPAMPGLQTRLEKGRTRIELIPAGQVGTRTLRVESPLGDAEARIRFTADTQSAPVAVGLLEANIDLAGEGDAGMGRWFDTDQVSPFEETEAGVEGAIYMKGRVANETLLTLRYDSDKEIEDDLFRSVEPDDFYPVYGDRSERGFDARSRGKLFARLERQSSYLMYGDVTYAAQADAIRLGRYRRTMEGARGHFESGRLQLDLFAGETAARQLVREIPGRGLSGPYDIDVSGVVRNSEQVELVTRDRDQPGVIIETRTLSRFTDYTLDYFTGSLILANPVPARDEDFNPVSLRVTFEADAGDGEEYLVSGAEAAFDLTDWMRTGLRQISADAPAGDADRREVGAVWLEATGDNGGVFQFEAARSDSAENGEGHAMRLSYERSGAAGSLAVRAAHASQDFDAPGAEVSSGRDEARLVYQRRLETGRFSGEALYTAESDGERRRYGAVARYERRLSDTLKLRGGGRYVNDRVEGNDRSDAFTLVAGASWSPEALGGATFDAEAEHELASGRPYRLSLSADYAVTARWRTYTQAQWSASRSGPFGFTDRADDVSVRAGTEYRWSDGISAFTEYRAREDFFDSGVAQGLAASWTLSPALSTRARLEHVQPLAPDFQRTTSAGIGATWEPEDRRYIVEGDLEYGVATNSQQSWYVSTTYGRRWEDVTLLSRTRLATTAGQAGRTRARSRLGWAHRPPTDDALNTLVWYEFDLDDGEDRRETRHTWSIGGEAKVEDSLRLRGRLAGQFYQLSRFMTGLDEQTVTLMVQAGAERDIARRWIAGSNLTTFTDGDFQEQAFAIGGEVGFVPARNTLIAIGYNHAFSEAVDTPRLYRDGWFMRLQLKFDDGVWDIFDRA
ncbi:MAG: DUF11 domain-containing protein [Alphaproteobacteria bacterium]|jgi:uncharacterized repeat protein (TIGR01451 family)|nr:DUF11 domain-containing protein [Alphaproteobacteria bacterium]